MAEKLKIVTRTLVAFTAMVFLSACTGMPKSVEPVSPFSVDKYLGTWYEIARLDHSFERGLSDVSAVYSLNDDGSIKVINRGFDTDEQKWQQADGRAVFVDDDNKGHLKVSFFGPFYSSYVVFFLEPDYSVALVSGFNSDYLWLLARKPKLDKVQISRYVAIAAEAGFETDKLIYPEQSRY
ncbi:lipocalin family protein [Photobacterium rosenbergii]|uniref:Outer membrane lipoprotein Blc n=1 Tax=Photobacterium rosenbergii TaxID=294936 RepID=A0ABU3ZHA2_9GAMM|nr:lipocalin family protein [Photobacterium rosenbergii]MDV5169427.1 lipocalin family protein [Photobacterium rosenbergii]